jgi:hypothetical protein
LTSQKESRKKKKEEEGREKLRKPKKPRQYTQPQRKELESISEKDF